MGSPPPLPRSRDPPELRRRRRLRAARGLPGMAAVAPRGMLGYTEAHSTLSPPYAARGVMGYTEARARRHLCRECRFTAEWREGLRRGGAALYGGVAGAATGRFFGKGKNSGKIGLELNTYGLTFLEDFWSAVVYLYSKFRFNVA